MHPKHQKLDWCELQDVRLCKNVSMLAFNKYMLQRCTEKSFPLNKMFHINPHDSFLLFLFSLSFLCLVFFVCNYFLLQPEVYFRHQISSFINSVSEDLKKKKKSLTLFFFPYHREKCDVVTSGEGSWVTTVSPIVEVRSLSPRILSK